MDVVYVNRDGENPELRYSLRSLKNVDHGTVWVFGGAPVWLNQDRVAFRGRAQERTSYSSTRAHLKAACLSPNVSDPFQLWNDDFFAMHPLGAVPLYHRGTLDAALEKFASVKTPWAKSLRETAQLIENAGVEEPMFYDVHLPLVVHKAEMLAALGWAKEARADAVHVRTLYGNLVGESGTLHIDPKMMNRRDPFPTGAWLSSGDNTFRYAIEPVLRYVFPDASPYEKD